LFYTVYAYVELLPVQFMTSFIVKYLGFPVHNASFLLSIFYGLHIAGNVIGVIISAFLRPRTMMLANLFMTVVSYLLLIAFVNVWPPIIWISSAGAGLAMATTWATGVLWISDIIPVTGLVASIMVIGYSSSGMVAPMFVGHLFESSTPMWFVYVVVAASIVHVVLFLCMMAFVRRFRKNLSKANAGRLENEIEIYSVNCD
jgi:MFS transporter, FHS family, Na+ dependent glucose transporter 1